MGSNLYQRVKGLIINLHAPPLVMNRAQAGKSCSPFLKFVGTHQSWLATTRSSKDEKYFANHYLYRHLAKAFGNISATSVLKRPPNLFSKMATSMVPRVMAWLVGPFKSCIPSIEEFDDPEVEEVRANLYLIEKTNLSCCVPDASCNFSQAWRRQFSADSFHRDIFGISLGFIDSVFVNSKVLLKYRQYELNFTENSMRWAILFWASNILLQLTVAAMLLFWRRTFALHRDNILLGHFLIKITFYYFAIMTKPTFKMIQKVELPTSTTGALFQLIFLPMMMARLSISLITPLRTWKYIGCSGILVMLYHNVQRCAEELAVQGQGQRYKDILLASEGLFYGRLSLPPTRAGKSASLLASSLSDTGACLATRSWLQLTFGFLLPLAILSAEETLSRKHFEKENALSTAFSHTAFSYFVRYLVLVPLESAFVLHSVIFLVHTFQL